MGQYWVPVCLDKKEFINPHQLGAGLKLGEQVGSFPATGSALLILCAAMPEHRGGGDLDLDENWYGKERQQNISKYPTSPAPMPIVRGVPYSIIAHRTIGRWAGCRVALVGDYAEDGDLKAKRGDLPASKIWSACMADKPTWTDVTSDVRSVIEHELRGEFSKDDGWCQFKFDGGDCKWVDK